MISPGGFFQFFRVLIFQVVRGSKSSHSIFQEPDIIWFWFLVQMCKMMISLAFFFFFLVLISLSFKGGGGGGGGGVKRQKMTKNYQFQSVLLSISATVDHITEILIIIYPCLFFFKKCNILDIKIIFFIDSTVF